MKLKDIMQFPTWYGIKWPSGEPGTLGRDERYKEGEYYIKIKGKINKWTGVRLFAKIESGL